jgi:hypothetical protein
MLGVLDDGKELVRRIDDPEIDPELIDGRPRSRAGRVLRRAAAEHGHVIEREDLDSLVQHQPHGNRAVESARKKTNCLHRMPSGLRRVTAAPVYAVRLLHQSAPRDCCRSILHF